MSDDRCQECDGRRCVCPVGPKCAAPGCTDTVREAGQLCCPCREAELDAQLEQGSMTEGDRAAAAAMVVGLVAAEELERQSAELLATAKGGVRS